MYSSKFRLDFLKQLISLMVNDTKSQTIAEFLEISSRTAYLWRMKIYTAVEELQKNIILSNKVWIDEKLIRVNKGNRFAIIAGRSHITSNECINTYRKHISEGSTIIHDGIFSHDKLIEYLKANSIVYKSTVKNAHKGLQRINSFLAEIEHFMVVHPGIRTEYLQKHMSWIAFKSSIKSFNMEEKVKEIVAICYKTKASFKSYDHCHRKNHHHYCKLFYKLIKGNLNGKTLKYLSMIFLIKINDN